MRRACQHTGENLRSPHLIAPEGCGFWWGDSRGSHSPLPVPEWSSSHGLLLAHSSTLLLLGKSTYLTCSDFPNQLCIRLHRNVLQSQLKHVRNGMLTPVNFERQQKMSTKGVNKTRDVQRDPWLELKNLDSGS
jgi:hypothetical protein